MERLRLFDYADKELLGVVQDEAGPDGWAWTRDIASGVGMSGKRKNQSTGIRLAWLKKYGVVELHESGRRWRLTPIGEVFMNGELSRTAERQLEQMEPGQLYTTARMMTLRLRREAEPVGHMVRREWRRGVHAG